MPALPSGTVTFLFTDIEGSTRALDELGPERYAQELARHRDLMRRSFAEHDGVEIDTQGDAFFVAFSGAQNALDAAQSAQSTLAGGAVAVRMGIHTGEPLVWAEGYVGVDVHRGARICAAAHGGQIVVSERTRELVEGPLVDLGLHRLKDLSEPQHLFQLGEGDFPALRTLHPTNLPVQATRLVDRARELADAAELLASHRLVSLIGPGGSGKTRLALQLAADVADEYPDGVFWVPLQAVRDPALVLPAIASAVGSKRDRLSDHIADRKLLLLLDNLEQVVDAAPMLAKALSEMPNIKLLTTSREPLRVRGEQRYPVEPLTEDDAVTLFNERASAVNSSFEPTESVAQICRRLDGLPLALELAAARVAVLHPDDLLTRFERSLPVLTSGTRDAPERHRTLRATLDWSYDLLDREEQAQFARLAVFEGSFDAGGAEAVAGVGLDALQSLVEKSLVRRWGGGRFGMLETVHEYAFERLAELPDHDEVRLLHAEHYIALAPAETELRGDAAGIWLDSLETERDNFRGALTWSANSGRLDLTCRLAAGFAPYWGTRGSSAEARTWMEATLQGKESLAPEHRGRYLRWAASVAFLSGESDLAWPLYEEALALSRALGDAQGEGLTLLGMATCAYDAGRLDDTARLLEEGADAFRRLGTGWGLPGVAINLGNLAVGRGDYELAEQMYTEALAEYRALNSPRNVMVALANLANLCVERGAPSEATKTLREAFEIAASDEDRHALAHVLNICSRVEVAEGSWRRAAVLSGARDHLLEETAERLFREDERIAVRERETVEAELGAAAFTKAWAEGAAMELDAVVRYVRAAR